MKALIKAFRTLAREEHPSLVRDLALPFVASVPGALYVSEPLFSLAMQGLFVKGLKEDWEEAEDDEEDVAVEEEEGDFAGGNGLGIGLGEDEDEDDSDDEDDEEEDVVLPVVGGQGAQGQAWLGGNEDNGAGAGHQEHVSAAVLPSLSVFTLDMTQGSAPHIQACIDVLSTLVPHSLPPHYLVRQTSCRYLCTPMAA